MKITPCFPTITRNNFLLFIIAAGVMLPIVSTTICAEEISFAEIAIEASEKLEALVDPTNMALMKGAAWDHPAVRRLNRNRPWISVENLSSSEGSLEQFNITIGDERFNFSNDNFANFTVISPISDIPAADVTTTPLNDDNELQLTLGNGGLAPGEKIYFQIHIGVDPDQTSILDITTYPDFRTVLFDMNGIDAYGPNPKEKTEGDDSDNSMVSGIVNFNGELLPTNTKAFPDATVTGNQAHIYNQFVRPRYEMEGIDVFDTGVLTAIPEPNTALLSMIGFMVVGLIAQRRTSERRQYSSSNATYRRQHDPRPQRQSAYRHGHKRTHAKS